MDTESIRNRINNLESQIIESGKKEQRFKEFESIDVLFVASKSDKDLALWQSKYPPDSPQHIIANHEWQRRLNVEQIKSNRFSAIIGIIGVVLGFILSSFYDAYKESKKTSEANKAVIKQENSTHNTKKCSENCIQNIKKP